MGRAGEQGGSRGIGLLETLEHQVQELVPGIEYQITGQGIQIVEEGFPFDQDQADLLILFIDQVSPMALPLTEQAASFHEGTYHS